MYSIYVIIVVRVEGGERVSSCGLCFRSKGCQGGRLAAVCCPGREGRVGSCQGCVGGGSRV